MVVNEDTYPKQDMKYASEESTSFLSLASSEYCAINEQELNDLEVLLSNHINDLEPKEETIAKNINRKFRSVEIFIEKFQ